MFGTLTTAPEAASTAPGAPTPTRASSLTRTPAVAAASVTASAMSFATASGPPCGVFRRAWPTTLPGPARDDGLDLRAAEVDPAAKRGRHASRRTTSSSGRRFARALHSSAVLDAASRGRSGRPNVRTITGVSSSPSSRTACAASRSASPFGHDAMPSFQAASSMFCAARPASNDTGPFPVTTIATTRPAPRTLSGAKTVGASASTRARPSTTTKVHGCLFDAEPARRPASRIRVTTSSGERLGPVAPLVAAARDRQERVHPSSVSAR